MKVIVKMIIIASAAATLSGCAQKPKEFKYTVDEFADLKIMRYKVPGWSDLTLNQKSYAYYLAEAAKWGRDIMWDQNCRHNIALRHVLEDILNKYEGERKGADWDAFLVYAKRVFFSNGIHHHYAEDKFLPECPQEYVRGLMEAVGDGDKCELLLPYMFDPELFPQRRCTAAEGDIVLQSGVNFYDGVTRAEVEKYYAGIEVPGDRHPIAYGLNSKVVKDDKGNIVELQWKSGGIYGAAIDRICECLEKAAEFADSDAQREYIDLLIKYYRTGDLRIWDDYNVAWVQDTGCKIDFINGFIEDYNDPLGRKGSWEANVNIKDDEASRRSKILSENAQWFEDNSPVDPRFKKAECKGVSAKVINVACLAGDSYPSTPIGINLPNADWIRKEYGSKSVTIANITSAYNKSADEAPNSTLAEFAYSEDEIALAKQYGDIASEIHTDLHECLGHGSGQLLPGVSSTAMGEYSSTLEEARADLFGLYYAGDPKLVELGILPSPDAYKAEYASFIRNGLMVQFSRVELGRQNTEAHMQDRLLIAAWCYEKGLKDNVIEKKTRGGKTYFVINDYEALRGLFGQLLAEVQRIKSEGDYAAGKALVETYAVNIDPDIHREVKSRYEALKLKPYGGFINPDRVPVFDKKGQLMDYKIVYYSDFLQQQLDYGRDYRALD